MIYKNLQEKLERSPMKKEWGVECKLQKVPYRIRDSKSYNNDNEYLLRSYQELKELLLIIIIALNLLNF